MDGGSSKHVWDVQDILIPDGVDPNQPWQALLDAGARKVTVGVQPSYYPLPTNWRTVKVRGLEVYKDEIYRARGSNIDYRIFEWWKAVSGSRNLVWTVQDNPTKNSEAEALAFVDSLQPAYS